MQVSIIFLKERKLKGFKIGSSNITLAFLKPLLPDAQFITFFLFHETCMSIFNHWNLLVIYPYVLPSNRLRVSYGQEPSFIFMSSIPPGMLSE